MNPVYLESLMSLLSLGYPDLDDFYQIEYKANFGAVSGYVQGHIFCSAGPFGFALKLPPHVIGHLSLEQGVQPLRYFAKGHVKKDYLVLPSKLINQSEKLHLWIEESLKFVLNQD